MTNETYPDQGAEYARETARLDALGESLYTPAEILALRERLGLTRKALGERLGVSERAVARWEDGERKMLTAHADRLAGLEESAEREVTRFVRSMNHLDQSERVMVVYRNDAHLRKHHPSLPVTAGWVRAIAGRVREAVDIDIVYAP